MWTGNVCCIQNIQTISAVTTEHNSVVTSEWRSMHPSFVHEGRNMSCMMINRSARISVYELMRSPPVTNLMWICRIRDIYDTHDHTFETLGFAGKIYVRTSVIHKTMNTDGVWYSTIPVTQIFRVLRIFFQAPDLDTCLTFHVHKFALLY